MVKILTEHYTNGLIATTLAVPCLSTDTTITVASAAGFPVVGFFRIRIDNELIRVLSCAGTTWTVERAVEQTFAIDHANGSVVDCEFSSGAVANFIIDTHNHGALADIPDGEDGMLFLPDDAAVFLRSNGSAWEKWGPFYRHYVPSISGWTWISQGNALASTAASGIDFTDTGETVWTPRGKVHARPAYPYSASLFFDLNLTPTETSEVGILLRESGTGKMVTWGLRYFDSTHFLSGIGAMGFFAAKWNGDGSYNSDYVGVNANIRQLQFAGAPVRWLRVRENTAMGDSYQRLEFSCDGFNWRAPYSFSSPFDWLAGGADQIGFYLAANNNAPVLAQLHSYRETSP